MHTELSIISYVLSIQPSQNIGWAQYRFSIGWKWYIQDLVQAGLEGISKLYNQIGQTLMSFIIVALTSLLWFVLWPCKVSHMTSQNGEKSPRLAYRWVNSLSALNRLAISKWILAIFRGGPRRQWR